MSPRWRTRWLNASLLAGSLLVGCRGAENLHYIGDADLHYYKASATQVSYPHVHEPVADDLVFSERPRTLRDVTECEIWDISLVEAVEMAIANSKVIRSRGQFKSPANQLLYNPDRVATTFDPALQETSPSFISRGPEAALSAFDATFKTTMQWNRNELIQNNLFLGGGIIPGNALVTEGAQFDTSIQKIFANGGAVSVTHDWNYLGTNQPFQLFPSVYRGFVRADYRQPLWAGAGTDYTRIAGPILRSIPTLSMPDQGVVIARINTDISIADFEANVTNLVRDVEDTYWDLYLAYRTYDAEVTGRDAALTVWRDIKTKTELNQKGGGRIPEAQARDSYLASRSRVENALGTLYATEGQLRRLLNLPVNDGRLLRPATDPLEAELSPDWQLTLVEALTHRVELRRQKWTIKSLQLQLTAVESLVNPRLDFIAAYQVNAFGDNLFGANDNPRVPETLDSAYANLTQGNYTGWNLGFEFTMPLGLRYANTQKRNLELRLAKARAVLAAQEHEISHELGNAIQLLDWWYRMAQTNSSRRDAAAEQLAAVESEYAAGNVTLDLLVRAQANLATAEVAYYTSLVRYNQAVTDVQLRKGTLLSEHNVQLAESAWTPEAYDEALRRAWARSHAIEDKHLHSEPENFALPAPQDAVPLVPPATESLLPPPDAPAPDNEPQRLPEPVTTALPEPTGVTPISAIEPRNESPRPTAMPSDPSAEKLVFPRRPAATELSRSPGEGASPVIVRDWENSPSLLRTPGVMVFPRPNTEPEAE